MRYVNIVLGVIMVAFAAVQYNDPDVLLWIGIYSIPAAWAFAAAFRRTQLRSAPWSTLLVVSLLAGIGAVLYYWPSAPEFWRKDVWWWDEEAREGMGAMAALAVMLFVAASAVTGKTRRS